LARQQAAGVINATPVSFLDGREKFLLEPGQRLPATRLHAMRYALWGALPDCGGHAM